MPARPNLAEPWPEPVKSGQMPPLGTGMGVLFPLVEAVARKRMRMLVSLVQSRLHLSQPRQCQGCYCGKNGAYTASTNKFDNVEN